MKDFAHSRWFHVLLLLVWIAVGASFRFAQLTAKPPWTDEFATLVFSLGHSFMTVPLDTAIALEALMQPLQSNATGNSTAVVQYLLAEDVHPPLYFVIAHWWMRLFPSENGFVSLWAARSLPALFGVLSIPAMFGLGWLAFRSLVVSHSAAAIMAVSPYGVYLAQEARHYTLAILWVIGCLCCLCLAVRAVQHQMRLPLWVGGLWVSVNALGLATHHFFLLTLCAAAIVLIGFGVVQLRHDRVALLRAPWRRLYAVALGTAATSLIWIPLWQSIRSHEITQWIQNDDQFNVLSLLNPIVQSLAAWITMLALLPVESSSIVVVVLAGLAMGIFVLWVVPLFWWALRSQRSQAQRWLGIQVLAGFVAGAIALFFLITYGLGTDLTRGARYSFVYFPAVIGLFGVSLAALWTNRSAIHSAASFVPASESQPSPVGFSPQASQWGSLVRSLSQKMLVWQIPYSKNGRAAVIFIWVVGCLSSLTVVGNLGYQKYYRPDLLVPLIQNQSQAPALIATTQNTLVQVGELMGIGWQVLKERQNSDAVTGASQPIQFLLAHQPQGGCSSDCVATKTLETTIAQATPPLDLWLVNFNAPVNSVADRCVLDPAPTVYVSGYDYQLYHCREEADRR